MSEFMSYDPWAEITTRNGYAGDEMVAMLQKAIRRGKEEDALHAAYEMYITSPQFEEKLWRRLLCISVEDIGFGNPDAPNLVYTLFKMRQEFPYNDGDRPMFFVHAIRYLCRQKKERSSDHVKNLLNHEFEVGTKFEVPDYALDMHTRRGREMGRDVYHFLTEASRCPRWPPSAFSRCCSRRCRPPSGSRRAGTHAPRFPCRRRRCRPAGGWCSQAH